MIAPANDLQPRRQAFRPSDLAAVPFAALMLAVIALAACWAFLGWAAGSVATATAWKPARILGFLALPLLVLSACESAQHPRQADYDAALGACYRGHETACTAAALIQNEVLSQEQMRRDAAATFMQNSIDIDANRTMRLRAGPSAGRPCPIVGTRMVCY